MQLAELLSLEFLESEVAEGYVRSMQHDGLTIYNYTEKTQFERRWNPVTLQCRGLIVDANGEVLARPFPKFFNHDEPEAQIDSGPVTVLDKLDGSLGIAYTVGDEVRIATRGSLSSEQALHATAILKVKCPDWRPPAGVTVLFEIIYPENRIVVDYHGMDDLVLLGGIDITTGASIPLEIIDWYGPRAESFEFGNLAEALTAPPRPNAEGYVVQFVNTGHRVKIKQDDYVRLHRIVTGWNERTIWEHLAAGKSIEELVDGLPDEFHRWAINCATFLTRHRRGFEFRAECAFTAIMVDLPVPWTRKDFALEAQKHPMLRPALFQLLDGKDITPWAWKQVRPTANKEATIG
ncbi:RNA ligase [Glutamicibacter sp. X7]